MAVKSGPVGPAEWKIQDIEIEAWLYRSKDFLSVNFRETAHSPPAFISVSAWKKDDQGLMDSFDHICETFRKMQSPYFPDLIYKDEINLKNGDPVDDREMKVVFQLPDHHTLAAHMAQNELSLKDILTIIMQTAQGLVQIHKTGHGHYLINPDNILINDHHGQVMLTNFGPYSLQRHPALLTANRNTMAAFLFSTGFPKELFYIAPEQTGRSNREADLRADLYSLGVVFYQMVAGRPPFSGDDTQQLIHGHLAKRPRFPKPISMDCPEAIKAIILKCLEKNPSDRYQSILEIREDIEQGLAGLETDRGIPNFSINRDRANHGFGFSGKFVGRKSELDAMMETYQASFFQQSVFMAIGGHSGIGKTALVQTFFDRLAHGPNQFHVPVQMITGKFDPLGHKKPYGAFVDAFRELFQKLFMGDDQQILSVKEKLKEELGENLSIIYELVPEAGQILSSRNAPAALHPKEAENRFHLTLLKFLSVFCHSGCPLILFLDDVHWADPASIKMLQFLRLSDLPFLTVITAYRDNEMEDPHPFPALVDGARESSVLKLSLKELPMEDIVD